MAVRSSCYNFPSDNFVASRDVIPITEHDAEKLHGGFENLIEELPAWQPFFALIENSRAVSVCRSVRITSEECYGSDFEIIDWLSTH